MLALKTKHTSLDRKQERICDLPSPPASGSIIHCTAKWVLPLLQRKLRDVTRPVFTCAAMANPQRAEDDSKHVKTAAKVTAVVGKMEPAADGSSSAARAGAAAVVACSIPSFAAASELLSAPYSCLVMNAHRRHISLPPVFLNKKRTGIQEELQAELLKFSER